jgi:hypothetical protein
MTEITVISGKGKGNVGRGEGERWGGGELGSWGVREVGRWGGGEVGRWRGFEPWRTTPIGNGNSEIAKRKARCGKIGRFNSQTPKLVNS